MPEEAPKLDLAIKPDTALYEAARVDCVRLRADYIDAVVALSKNTGGEEELRRRQARADRSRAYLSQALHILDMARGDYAE